MGNYASCALAIAPAKAVRVIFPGGEIREFRSSLKAAEIMLDLPNFFAADSRSLRIGRRFSSLAADDDLVPGSVYVMFPMRRRNSLVVAGDLATVFFAAKRNSDGKVRILPHSDAGDSRSPANENGINNRGFDDQMSTEFKYRLATCRSRKPMLETIKEEPIRLR